jgi:hypothetical protein
MTRYLARLHQQAVAAAAKIHQMVYRVAAVAVLVLKGLVVLAQQIKVLQAAMATHLSVAAVVVVLAQSVKMQHQRLVVMVAAVLQFQSQGHR